MQRVKQYYVMKRMKFLSHFFAVLFFSPSLFLSPFFPSPSSQDISTCSDTDFLLPVDRKNSGRQYCGRIETTGRLFISILFITDFTLSTAFRYQRLAIIFERRYSVYAIDIKIPIITITQNTDANNLIYCD